MRNERGVVLVLAYFYMTILMAFCSAIMVRGLTDHHAAQLSVWSASVFQTAEAGMDEALSELKADAAWSGTPAGACVALPQGGCYEVTVASLGGSLRQIISVGHVPDDDASSYGYQRRQLEAIISVATSPFDYAVFAKTTVTMDSNTTVDSYDSEVGLYGDDNQGASGDIGSNAIDAGTITLASGAEVHGDAVVGPGGDTNTAIVKHKKATITGSQGSLSEEKAMAPEEFPDCDPTEPLEVNGTTETLDAGTYDYTYVKLNSNSTVEVTGDVTLRVKESFTMESNTEFKTTCEGCTITIYIEGAGDPDDDPAFALNSNTAVLTADDDPTKLTIYVTGESQAADSARPVSFASNSGLYGAIHAPLSDMDVNSNATVYGSLIGNSLQLDSNAAVHYDTALLTGGGGGGVAELKSWRDCRPDSPASACY